MRVLKFGGSSLATPQRVKEVGRIVAAAREAGPVGVVVSAFGGVTDTLIEAALAASRQDEAYLHALKEIGNRHWEAAQRLAAPEEREAIQERIVDRFRRLGELLRGVCTVGEASPRTLDRIACTGELLSALLLAATLRARGIDAEDCDARRLIVTGPEFGRARVHVEPTEERIRSHFGSRDALQVVTGFIAATAAGETTTLGRGGSDYTASILGAALEAEAVEIWTDVDGVLSADPRIVPEAVLADRLSYDELMELSHFGAKVVFPPSVHPTRTHAIPLWIKNTFRPEAPGTLITNEVTVPESTAPPPVRGVASIGSVVLVRLEGDGMVGVPGIAMRLFGALARGGVSVIMISQASSEHSICFAIAPDDQEAATREIGTEFEAERRAGLIDELIVEPRMSIVAAVGAGMHERSGVAGNLFSVLGRHGINVRAIAQGSSELNISLVVSEEDERRAVRAIHDAFFLPGWRTIDIGLAGVGRVGSALLAQIAEQQADLEERYRLRLRLVAVAGRRGAVLDPQGIDPPHAAGSLRDHREPASADEMLEAMTRDRGAKRIFVDCTASREIGESYEALLESGAAVVTANKLRLAGPLAEYRRLHRARPGRLYAETTVGAALPILGTLRDLIATGDQVHRIEGIFSGTLAYILDEVGKGRAFGEAVRGAHERSYTEPDPREDLGGRDVARKLLILARVCGREMEPEAIEVESLVADEWRELALDDFWSRVGESDTAIASRQREAASRGERLIYLATLDEEGARVALTAVPPAHPAYGARGTNNLIAFTTDRYADDPLIVQGPGAGPQVTAAGVFADILRAIDEEEGVMR